MPYINVRIAAERLSDSTVSRLMTGITDIMSDILGKQRSLVAVSIETGLPRLSFIAGHAVNPDEMGTAYVTVYITQGSNTEEEKSRAIQAIFQLLEAVLGTMEEATYIVLQSIPATDWGYSGKTLLDRKTEVKRQENGAIDTKHYLRRSRHLRSKAICNSLQKLTNRVRRNS